jgi:hypothetical protein
MNILKLQLGHLVYGTLINVYSSRILTILLQIFLLMAPPYYSLAKPQMRTYSS